MKAKQLFDYIFKQITVYESQETKEIVFWLLEYYLGLKKIDVISDKTIDNHHFIDWENIVKRLNNHEPIQYILGETEFYGRKFLVNPSVLIPRPETEELVDLIRSEELGIRSQELGIRNYELGIVNCESLTHHRSDGHSSLITHLSLLDIGTGSGCIAISLAKELPDFEVFGYDISEKALETAKKNAELHNVKVIFENRNILNHSTFYTLHSTFNIIVSNPPYVTKSEIAEMRKNVIDYEPHLALFVENNDPLIFYVAIADFAHKTLKNKGLVVVEINEKLGIETAKVFIEKGFSDVEIIKDIHQKDRFVIAKK